VDSNLFLHEDQFNKSKEMYCSGVHIFSKCILFFVILHAVLALIFIYCKFILIVSILMSLQIILHTVGSCFLLSH